MLPNAFPVYFVYPALFFPASTQFPTVKQEQIENEGKVEESKKEITKKLLNLTEEDLRNAGPHEVRKKWTKQEDQILLKFYPKRDRKWNNITNKLSQRNKHMAQSRRQRLRFKTRSGWEPEQDAKLRQLVVQHGKKWHQIVKYFPKYSTRQLEERYENHARQGISKEPWSFEEEMKLVNLLNEKGKQWKILEDQLPGRSIQQIKNQFHSRLTRIMNDKEKTRKKKKYP